MTSIIYSSDCKINIKDIKKMGDLYVHTGKVEKGSIKVGQNVNLEIDVNKEIIQELITQQHIYYTSL